MSTARFYRKLVELCKPGLILTRLHRDGSISAPMCISYLDTETDDTITFCVTSSNAPFGEKVTFDLGEIVEVQRHMSYWENI